jgi:hypothetical protein
LAEQTLPTPVQIRESWDSESRASAISESAHHSVGAGVWPAVLLVIRAIKAVAVKAAANEMTSSIAKVISVHAGDVTSTETADATSAKATDAASAETADVTSAEATHMASTKAAHMASTAATSMATATATAGLRVSGKKAAGKQCAYQNRHHSSSHDILRWDGRGFPPQGLVRRWRVRGRQMPTSRWSKDEDTDLWLPLNSRSITRSAIAGVFSTPEI